VVRLPLILVGLTVVFNLWALHPNAYTTTYANDSSVHVSMARWAEMRISEGHLPFDGWFPYLDLGSSRFHHYQALPAILTGAAGTVVGTEGAFHWLTYLLIALWPICIYASTRLLEWEPWVAAMAAVVSPLIASQPSLGYEWSSYTWGGYGLYTQLWGMWLLPFSWALTWRAVSGRGRYWPAALLTALTIGAHLLTGYLALLVIGLWVATFVVLQLVTAAVGSAYSDKFTGPDTDSSRALSILAKSFPTDSKASIQIVFKAEDGSTLTSPANREQISEVTDEIAGMPHVSAVVSPLTIAAGSTFAIRCSVSIVDGPSNARDPASAS